MSRTLVIILSETHSHELTFNSFKKNVIDELNADLCLCIGVKKDYDYNNPFYQLAKHKFLYDKENDCNFRKSFEYSYNNTDLSEKYEKIYNRNYLEGKFSNANYSDDNIKYLGEYNDENEIDLSVYPENEAFVYLTNNNNDKWKKKFYSVKNKDETYVEYVNKAEKNQVMSFVRRKHYSEFVKIKNRMYQEKDDTTIFSNFTISSYIHIFFLWFLHKNLKENNLIDQYDRFIITRSDYHYQLPFPKIELLNEKYIWIPDAEDYGGLCNRCVVFSKLNFEKGINILENFYKKSNKYYSNIQSKNNWNMEQIFKMHLEENGIIHNVKRFPYIMYSVINVNGATGSSEGYYSQQLGHCIKYISEYEISTRYKNEFEKSGLTIDEFYKNKFNINMDIIAISICVNFADILKHVLYQNHSFFKLWYIVTSPEDVETIELIKSKQLPNVELLIYNDFFLNATFNKGGALQFAQDYIDVKNNDKLHTILVLDSDIYLPDNFLDKIPVNIQDNTLYGVRERYDFWYLNDFLHNVNGRYHDGSRKFTGFFQLYKQNSGYKYKNSNDCRDCDNNFRDLFQNKVELDLSVKHLGRHAVNWYGRKWEI